MARFYQTTPSQQVDYTVDPRLYKAMSGSMGKKSATKATAKDLLNMKVQVVPDDIPDYQEVRKEYEGEVSKLTEALRKSPEQFKALEPAIAQLQTKMAADQAPGGRLYAFNYKAAQYNELLDQAKKQSNGDADLYDYNVSRIDASGGYIDENGRPIPVKANFTTAWDQKSEQDFLKTLKTTITPKLLKDAEVKNLEIGSKYKDAVTVMTDLGYSKDDVAEYIVGNMTPDMLKSMRHSFDYASSRGQAPAASFEEFMVGKVDGWATGISGVKSANRSNIQFDTEAGAAAKASRAAAGADKEFTNSWFPIVDVMKDAVVNPESPELREAIANKTPGKIEVKSLRDALISQATGSNFGINNDIVNAAYDPSTGKFYYKGLYDLREGEGSAQDEWVELSTATIDNLKGNAKFDVERFARNAKKAGILGDNNLFDFSKLTPNAPTNSDPRNGF